MTSFDYTLTDADPAGIHVRSVGPLIAKFKEFPGHTVTITKGDKSVNALRSFQLMGMGIKPGDTITVTVEGENETAAAEAFRTYFAEHL